MLTLVVKNMVVVTCFVKEGNMHKCVCRILYKEASFQVHTCNKCILNILTINVLDYDFSRTLTVILRFRAWGCNFVFIKCIYKCNWELKKDHKLPVEKKDIRTSTMGQSSTGVLIITSSSKINVFSCMYFFRRVRISFIGLEFDFLLMAQIPTVIFFISSK